MTRRDQRRRDEPARGEDRILVTSTQFLNDLAQWISDAPRTAARVIRLMIEIAREPHGGVGKPEPLRHDLGGFWSRRITDEHRLVYRVLEERIEFIWARHHYA
jgi:toxin YoeB